MAVESGKDGKVLIGGTPVADITRWEFHKTAGVRKYASSSTAGFRKAVAGVKDGQGTIEFKWDAGAASPLVEGSGVTLLLYTNASEFFSVPAVIDNFRLSVDIDSGDISSVTATFETNGAWTEPTLA